MFKRPFLLVLSVLSLLFVTLAVSRPFPSAPVSGVEGANDFHQRHPNWSRNLEASDYYERHTERNESESIADFALRHGGWTFSLPNAAVDVIDTFGSSDYFQRHSELSSPAARTTDLTDYFVRHPELRTVNTAIDLSDYFLRH